MFGDHHINVLFHEDIQFERWPYSIKNHLLRFYRKEGSPRNKNNIPVIKLVLKKPSQGYTTYCVTKITQNHLKPLLLIPGEAPSELSRSSQRAEDEACSSSIYLY